MTPREAIDALRAAIESAELVELPGIIGALTELEVRARIRVRELGVKPAPPAPLPRAWIKPAEAAAIAGVPVDRLYVWAKGKRWAFRPSRRCLRIEEEGFRRWLASRA